MIDERVAVNLDSMKEATKDALSFAGEISEAQFLASSATHMACSMCLIIIGESAARIERQSPDFVAAHPDWPWAKIRGLRTLIAHNYERVDLSIVWVVVRESLPDLLSRIEGIGELDPRLWPKD